MVRETSLLVVLLVVVGGFAGCRRTPTSSDSEPAGGNSPTGGQPPAVNVDINRLRSLPYAGIVHREPEESADQDGVVYRDSARSYPGYNLYSIKVLCTAELIDAEGTVVRSWSHPGFQWAHAELLPNGDLLAVGADPPEGDFRSPADSDRYLLRFNWWGELLWKRRIAAHHDVERTPRGRLLTLTFKRRGIPAVNRRFDTRDDQLTLLADDGELLACLSLYDVISAKPQVFPLLNVRPDPTPPQRWVDLFHANSIEWAHHPDLVDKHPIYAPAAILVCFRHQNRIAVVNWDDQELVWAWGQHELRGPHDAQYLANGHILVFDNGLGRGWSRVIELDPLARRIVWEYQAPNPRDFYSASRGSNQRLPNGNTLIANSDNGMAFEVTPEGEVVWKFLCPHRDEDGRRMTIARIKRYETTLIEGIGQRGNE